MSPTSYLTAPPRKTRITEIRPISQRFSGEQVCPIHCKQALRSHSGAANHAPEIVAEASFKASKLDENC